MDPNIIVAAPGGKGLATGEHWPIGSGSAGAYHTRFLAEIGTLGTLEPDALRATQWQGKQHQKMAEFVVQHLFP